MPVQMHPALACRCRGTRSGPFKLHERFDARLGLVKVVELDVKVLPWRPSDASFGKKGSRHTAPGGTSTAMQVIMCPCRPDNVVCCASVSSVKTHPAELAAPPARCFVQQETNKSATSISYGGEGASTPRNVKLNTGEPGQGQHRRQWGRQWHRRRGPDSMSMGRRGPLAVTASLCIVRNQLRAAPWVRRRDGLCCLCNGPTR